MIRCKKANRRKFELAQQIINKPKKSYKRTAMKKGTLMKSNSSRKKDFLQNNIETK